MFKMEASLREVRHDLRPGQPFDRNPALGQRGAITAEVGRRASGIHDAVRASLGVPL